MFAGLSSSLHCMAVNAPWNVSWCVCCWLPFFLLKEMTCLFLWRRWNYKVLWIKERKSGKKEWGFGNSSQGVCLAASRDPVEGFELAVVTSQLCILVEGSVFKQILQSRSCCLLGCLSLNQRDKNKTKTVTSGSLFARAWRYLNTRQYPTRVPQFRSIWNIPKGPSVKSLSRAGYYWNVGKPLKGRT